MPNAMDRKQEARGRAVRERERQRESGIAKKLLSGRAAAAIAYNNEFKAPLA